jgi:glycosyltransferase involved in cell wall biosynthesis
MVTAEPPSAKSRGGRPQATHASLLELSRRHAITLVTQAGGDPSDRDAIAMWRAAGVDVRVVAWPRYRGVRLWVRRMRLATSWLTGREPWKNVLYRDRRIQNILDQLLSEKRVDLVLVEDNLMGGYDLQTQLPVVLTEHEVRRPRRVEWRPVLMSASPRRVLGELDWQRWSGYQRKVWDRFDRIVCVTDEDATIASQLLPRIASRIRVNPLGIEVPQALDPSLEEPETIVFVGAMSHSPNVDAAVWLASDIMPVLRRKRPGVRLYIVGHSPTRSVLALASADVFVTGAVASVEPFLARAAVVVAPVRIGGGLRTKVIQAMAFGKPVVTSERGGRGIGDPGDDRPLIVADDAFDFASKCDALLADPERRHALGRRGRNYVIEHHSPRAYVDRLERVFEEILPSPSLPQLTRA